MPAAGTAGGVVAGRVVGAVPAPVAAVGVVGRIGGDRCRGGLAVVTTARGPDPQTTTGFPFSSGRRRSSTDA